MTKLSLITKTKYHVPNVFRKLRLRTWIAIGIILVLLPIAFITLYKPGSTEATWYSDNWQYRRKITIDNTKVSGNLNNFPVLINIASDSNIASGAQTSGNDILFTDEYGTKLNHEIESYTSGTGALVAWVRVPHLKGDEDTVLYLYYGNSSASDQQNATGVWDNNYLGVWHLGESSTGSAPVTRADSTSYSHDLTDNNTTPSDAGGQIGNAASFEESNSEYLSILNSALNSNFPGKDTSLNYMTFEGWVNSASLPTAYEIDGIMSKRNGGGANVYEIILNDNDDSYDYLQAGVNANYAQENPWSVSIDTWYYVVMTFDATLGSENVKLYIDSSQVGTANYGLRVPDNTDPFSVGVSSSSRYWDGSIDEVRMSDSTRSTDWITTSFNNQDSPSTFYSLGYQQARTPGPVAYWKFDEGVDNTCGTNDACDSTKNANHGANSGATWQTEDLCVFGKCLYFDGSNDVVTVANTVAGVKSVSFWAKVVSTSTTEQLLDLNGTDYLTSTSGTVTAAGFGTETIYVDGVAGSTSLTANKWHHIAVTTSSSLSASAIKMGQISTNYGQVFIDEMKLYPYERSAAQVKVDYTNGAEVLGVKLQEPLSEGLVGYWKMEEAGDADRTDSSGTGNTLTESASDTIAQASGKYGNSADFELGDTEWLTITDANQKNLELTNSYTVNFWINFESESQSMGFITKGYGYSATDHYAVYWAWYPSTSRYHLNVWHYNSGNVTDLHSSFNGDNISTGTWYMFSVVYNQTDQTLVFCLNGVCDAKQSMSYAPGDNAGPVYVGTGHSTTGYLDGKLDEFRVYNRPLSDKEVRDLYNWAPGPLLHYKLDEGSGSSAFDSSTGGYNGTLDCAEVGCTVAKWQPGKFGNSLYFDPANTSDGKYIYRDAVNIPSTAGASISLSLWVKPGTTQYSTANLVRNGSTEPNYALYVTSNTKLTFEVYSGGDYRSIESSNNLLTVNQWNHVTAIFTQGSGVSYYINGVFIETDALAYTSAQASGQFIIGSCYNTYAYLGYLDDLKIYNYARTPTQVIEDMNAGNPAPGSPLGSQAVYWKFDEGVSNTCDTSNNDACDSASAVSSNGALTGASWLTQSSCKINGCLSFDASGEVIAIATANDAEVDFGGGEPFSGSAWVYVTTMPTSTASDKDAIIAKWDTTSSLRQYRLYIENDDTDTTGNFEVDIMDESTAGNEIIYAETANDAVSQNTWYHVAFTFNGGQTGAAGGLKLYVNGVYKAQNSANASFLGVETLGSDFTVGEYDVTDTNAADTAFTGYIDEVKVYPTELSEDQVKIDYDAGAAVNYGTGQVEAAQLTDGAGNPPILYLPFDENNGTTAYDKSGNGLNGTLYGTNTTWKPGKVGSSVFIDVNDPTTSRVQISDNDLLDVGDTDDLTITGWARSYSSSVDRTFVAKKASATGSGAGYITYINDSNGFFRFHIADGTDNYQLTGTTNLASLNNWFHFAVVWDQDSTANTEVYINGKAENAGESCSTSCAITDIGSAANSTLLFIGLKPATPTYEEPFDGMLDNIKIYKYALTPAQVAYDYNRGRPIGYWKFDECQGTTAYDSSDSGKNGTINYGALDNTAAGTCGSGTSTEMWDDGTTGKYNASLGFDDSDDYVSVPTYTNLTSVSDFTVAAWIKSTGTNETIVQVHDGSATATADELRLRRDSSSTIEVKTNSVIRTNTTTTLVNGTWYHVAVTRAGTTLNAYIDGKLESSVTDSSGALNLSLCNFLIGADNDTASCSSVTPTNVFEGQIDDVRLYNYALSVSQIRKVFENDAGVRFGPSTGQP